MNAPEGGDRVCLDGVVEKEWIPPGLRGGTHKRGHNGQQRKGASRRGVHGQLDNEDKRALCGGASRSGRGSGEEADVRDGMRIGVKGGEIGRASEFCCRSRRGDSRGESWRDAT